LDIWNAAGWAILFIALAAILVAVWWTWFCTLEIKDALEHSYHNNKHDDESSHHNNYTPPPPPPCPSCHCPPPSIHIDTHEKPCRCETISKTEDALTDFFDHEPWKLFNITDFKRFELVIHAPEFPFGGSFQHPLGFARFLRRISSTLDIKETLLLGQWSSGDCTCRHVTTRWRIHAYVNCPLMPYSYDYDYKDGVFVWFDLIIQTRFDEHSDDLVGMEWFYDSALILRNVRKECKRRRYGGEWDWYEPHMDNWSQWEHYPPKWQEP